MLDGGKGSDHSVDAVVGNQIFGREKRVRSSTRLPRTEDSIRDFKMTEKEIKIKI